MKRSTRPSEPARDTEALRETAGVEIFLGDYAAALAILLRALEHTPNDALLWNDLSVALAEQARTSGRQDARALTRALDAAAHAVTLAPSLLEGHFNLALQLEAVGLPSAAVQSWEQVLKLEPDDAWRQETSDRLQRLRTAMHDRWTEVRAALLNREVPPRSGVVQQAAAEWPQQARELVEEELLPRWGRAITGNDLDGAREWLSRARSLSAALAHAVHDSLLVDAIDRIDAARSLVRSLARAHAAYGDGIALYEESRREEALSAFTRARALFETTQSPFGLKADLEVGVILYQVSRFAEADRLCARAVAQAARRHYIVAEGLAHWLRGIALMQRDAFERSMHEYRLAAAAFMQAGEHQGLASVESAAADTLRRIGEHSEGWDHLTRALANLSQVRSTRRRYTMLLNASLFASDDGLPRSALLFQNASLDAARERGTANTLVEGLIRRARLYLEARNGVAATSDLDEAEGLLPRIASPSARAYVEAWLTLTRAESLTPREPLAAIPLFNRALGFLSKVESSEVPAVLLEAGQASLGAGDEAGAAQYFQNGLQVFEGRLHDLAGTQHRVSYLDDGWGLFTALIELHAIRHDDPARAFALEERGRTRGLDDRSTFGADLDLPRVQSRLTSTEELLYYVVLKSQLLVWHIRDDRVRFVIKPISQEGLERQVLAYRQLLEAGRPAAEFEPLAKALYDVLDLPETALDHHQGTLAIVPDGCLYGVPFAALVDADGRYLIEQRPVTVAPSASYVFGQPINAARAWGPLNALLVGGNSIGPAAEHLERIPAAALELKDVARFYPSATALIDDQATLARLRAILPTATVLHFAGHAVANEEFPWRSHLVLSPDPANPDGTVSIDRLSVLDFTRLQLVVLSACRTAGGRILHGDGVISLVRPFLRKGVPAVVGSLWDVEDDLSREFFIRFHSAYAESRDPVAALRRAQVQAFHDSNPLFQHPRAWAGFVVSAVSRRSDRPTDRRDIP